MSFLKSSKFGLLAISLSLIVSCSDTENFAQLDAPQETVTPQQNKISAEPTPSPEPKKRTPNNGYVIPPLPKGVEIAVDCGPIAARFEEHQELLLNRGWCGYLKADGSIQIDAEVTALLDYTQPSPAWLRDSKDLKCLFIYLSNKKRGFAYVRKNGHARFAPFPYGNGCQPFGNGVFIQYLDGLVVYTDENFEPVKETNYVLADGFYNHLSKVCLVKPEKKYDSHGEHFEWIGGQCGYIGTAFQIVEPVIHAYENTPRPKGGKYDGDEPTGSEAHMVEALRADLPNGETLEAVFLKGGCNFQSRYSRNPAQCDEKYPGLPAVLYKEGHSIREIHLRQEDQTYYRGLVVYNGAPGFQDWEREIYWHSVEPMEAPVQD